MFGFIPKSNFWCVFDVFLDFVILVYFNAISINFYAVKCFICINYMLFPCLLLGECQRFKCLMNFNDFFMYLFR